MDWNLKAPTWDLTEVDQANLPSIEAMNNSSNSFGIYRTMKGEFSVDLKLGQVGNSCTESVLITKSKDAAGGGGGACSKMMTSSTSSSGSSKRARAINNRTQTVSCLVDGCQADLSNCRDYHRRHKVCELHSKTAQVTIGGQKQRFCQQCSRFHSLEEFDEGKRSCRKRLDGHNRRRRKPQPQLEPLTRSGSFLSNYQGTQLLPFSSSHVYPSTAVVNPSWGGGVVTSCPDATRLIHSHNQHHQQVHLVDRQDLFLGSSPTSSYKEGKQLAFMHQQQGDQPTVQSPHLPGPAASSMGHTFRRSSPFSESSSSNGLRCKMFCDTLTSSVHDSSCALSLLSSPPPQSQTHNHMVNPHSSSFMQPLGLSLLHDHSLGPLDSVLGPNGSDHCSSMYNMGSSGSQGNEAPPIFPFQWE